MLSRLVRPASRSRLTALKGVSRVVYCATPHAQLREASPIFENLQSQTADVEAPFFLLGQLMESTQPENAWAQREDVLSKISLAATLDQGDMQTASAIAGWVEDLCVVLNTTTAQRLVPLFSELFAVKLLRSMYSERRVSYMMQRQASRDAAAHLVDSISALEAHVREETPVAGSTIGGITGLAQRLEMRYTAQIKELDAETFRATSFLREIEGESPAREVEAATGASEQELTLKLDRLLEDLRVESLQTMLRERVMLEARAAVEHESAPAM